MIVLDGKYVGARNRDIDCRGKDIIVRSANGPDACVIDCEASKEGSHRGFTLQPGEGGHPIFEGFTITDGFSEYGGEIWINDPSTVTATNCDIQGGFPGDGNIEAGACGFTKVYFSRGDLNADNNLDISDAIGCLLHLFAGASPTCLKTADVNDSGVVDVSDPIHLLRHLFLGEAPPAAPCRECGFDFTTDEIPRETYALCER